MFYEVVDRKLELESPEDFMGMDGQEGPFKCLVAWCLCYFTIVSIANCHKLNGLNKKQFCSFILL